MSPFTITFSNLSYDEHVWIIIWNSQSIVILIWRWGKNTRSQTFISRVVQCKWILIWNSRCVTVESLFGIQFRVTHVCQTSNSYIEIKCLASYFHEEINILQVNSYLEFTTKFSVTPPMGRMMHMSGINIFKYLPKILLKT